jgi:hypothetical protein
MIISFQSTKVSFDATNTACSLVSIVQRLQGNMAGTILNCTLAGVDVLAVVPAAAPCKRGVLATAAQKRQASLA